MPDRGGARGRFLTSVLMTDIVGSTEHAAELGDAGWRDLIQLHHAVVRAALREADGREMDTAGDGFFAIFDAPAAAAECALRIVDDVRALGLDVRAGLHVGEVEQMAGKVGGLTVVVAARIMAAAAPGEVLVSSTVRDLAAGSGLAFEDRGARELKGVPGEWHVFAVAMPATETVDAGGPSTATERRAAAVRRARARPIWQRRPRLVAGAVLGLAAILATAGLLVVKPWQPAALASVTEDSVGIIDPSRGEVVGEIPVGTRPGGIAVGGGSAWVTNTGADSVSQIDLAKRLVGVRIDVGHAPKGIAATADSVWVANSGERTVFRINLLTGRVSQRIEVGNGPTAIVASGGGLWVANAIDSTIVRIDAATGEVGALVGVAATPVALAADATDLWVASEDGASISHHDPVTGATLEAPIRLNARPTALALDPTSVWVTSADGKVTRIDRRGGGVTATIPVGHDLVTIAVDGDAVWVGDAEGSAYRIDTTDASAPPRRISTSSAVTALAVIDGGVWLAAQASARSHRGGTLRIVEAGGLDAPDPTQSSYYYISLVADGLMGYRRTGGSVGSALLPDLAASVPVVGGGGRTYTFRLRPGLLYSTGAAVRPADFRRAIERSFTVGGWGLFSSVDGAAACLTEDGTAVATCDLSKGVVTDDALGTVTFNLTEPDPDFQYKLAHPIAYPIPDGVPMNAPIDSHAFPGTGPYTYIGRTESGTGIRFGRNPHFHVWDADVRPDGFPDEIVFTQVDSDVLPIQMVENGDADVTSSIAGVPDALQRISVQYPGRIVRGYAGLMSYVMMNTTVPPFDDINARKALNFALDRATLSGGVGMTCQILPPGFPGYQPYCPYTLRPDASGRWTAPDLKEAQRLIDASGTRGQKVTFGPRLGWPQERFEAIGATLRELGYDVTLDARGADDIPGGPPAWWNDKTQIAVQGWGADYLAAGNFMGILLCDDPGITNYCDPGFAAMFDHALQLQVSDQAAALAEWAAMDRRAVDLALIAPIDNTGQVIFVSDRVGNAQTHSSYGGLYDQMWVQ